MLKYGTEKQEGGKKRRRPLGGGWETAEVSVKDGGRGAKQS